MPTPLPRAPAPEALADAPNDEMDLRAASVREATGIVWVLPVSWELVGWGKRRMRGLAEPLFFVPPCLLRRSATAALAAAAGRTGPSSTTNTNIDQAEREHSADGTSHMVGPPTTENCCCPLWVFLRMTKR